MVKDFHDIEALVGSHCSKPRRVLVVGNCFTRWMQALKNAADAGLVRPMLIGNQVIMRENAELHEIGLSDFEIIHSIGGAVELAVEALRNDTVDVLIRGDVGILDMLSALFRKESGFRIASKVVSGISAHFIGRLGRILFITDPIVIPAPGLNMKIALIENAATYLRVLGFDRPNVALTAAVEEVHITMQHTVEAAIISKMSDRGQIEGCVVDGPLSLDTAVIESAAKDKEVVGPVAGKADILVQPTIETSYGMYKALTLCIKAPTGSVVVGGKVPMCVTSRTDSVDTNYHSLLMALASLHDEP